MDILIEYTLKRTKLPIISVLIEDKKMCFILDTGSTCSLIDSSVVEYFKDIVEPIGEYFVNGIDGTKHKVDTIVIPLMIEGQIYNQKFCVKPLLEAFEDIEKECGIQVHGLLGTDFLYENKCIVDFKEKNIIIEG